jgi:hypothetical protein
MNEGVHFAFQDRNTPRKIELSMIHSRFVRLLRGSALALATICILPFLTPPLNAQTYEFAVTGGLGRTRVKELGSLQLSSEALDDDTTLKTDIGYGGRITLNTPGYYGHELSYLYRSATVTTKILDENDVRVTKEGKAQVHQVGYDFLMYMMPAKEVWRPFIAAGVHATQYQRPRIDEFDRSSTRAFGFQYGGGIKFFIAKKGIIRLDARHYIGGPPYDLSFQESVGVGDQRFSAGRVRNLEATIGFGLAF